MSIEFNINEYVFSHGHAPRGRGHWAFRFGRGGDPVFIQGELAYSEAKRQAREMAIAKNVSVVYVCP